MMLRHFKEEFIIKNSVNGGAPLSRWKLRDDDIPTLFLGYKDGVAPNKKYRKQTTYSLSNNGCHKQPEEKLDDRTTSDVKSAELDPLQTKTNQAFYTKYERQHPTKQSG
ncbi:hypothetical protein DAPPUDRAFT_265570 [Daphnia pulex]|uniref:Uncharacterized protein n=1 Tax=Daphnia pulex TaxID=6669 RepID=E9HTM8_DAPPU|nr:hypothetical protein DAPPUDRAFT_265570 [Daphnia pulex]|eukprot:EFX64906.1 hypothetical protein DAPPUDRAFT_265570 [Daphnia pulex]